MYMEDYTGDGSCTHEPTTLSRCTCTWVLGHVGETGVDFLTIRGKYPPTLQQEFVCWDGDFKKAHATRYRNPHTNPHTKFCLAKCTDSHSNRRVVHK